MAALVCGSTSLQSEDLNWFVSLLVVDVRFATVLKNAKITFQNLIKPYNCILRYLIKRH